MVVVSEEDAERVANFFAGLPKVARACPSQALLRPPLSNSVSKLRPSLCLGKEVSERLAGGAR
jgi:hypothetical protein